MCICLASSYAPWCFWDLFLLLCISIVYSLLWLSSMSLYEYNIVCLYIFQVMDTWVVFSFWLQHIKLLWILYKCFYKHKFSCLLNKYLGIGLLSNKVNVCLTFREVVSFHFIQAHLNIWEFWLLFVFTNI